MVQSINHHILRFTGSYGDQNLAKNRLIRVPNSYTGPSIGPSCLMDLIKSGIPVNVGAHFCHWTDGIRAGTADPRYLFFWQWRWLSRCATMATRWVSSTIDACGTRICYLEGKTANSRRFPAKSRAKKRVGYSIPCVSASTCSKVTDVLVLLCSQNWLAQVHRTRAEPRQIQACSGSRSASAIATTCQWSPG